MQTFALVKRLDVILLNLGSHQMTDFLKKTVEAITLIFLKKDI